MDPIKLLHINAEMGWGGGETQTYYLIQALRARDYRQAVACQPESALARRCEKDRVPAFLAKMSTQFSVGAVARLRRVMWEGNFQIIHCHTSRAHTLGVLAALGMDTVKSVVTRRIEHRPGNWWKTQLIYNQGTDAIVAISEAVKEVLISAGVLPDKLQVIQSGVDLERFKAGNGQLWRNRFRLPSDSLVVGYVGKLSQGKGVDVLIRTIPGIVARRPASHFLIVGDGPCREEFECLAAELKVGAHVTFPGFVEDVPGVLAALDIFVMPSFKEAAGGAVREAMAAGKPVIASRVGGLPEGVVDGETGFLVPPGDHESLSRSILALVDDSTLRERFGTMGRERARLKFSVETMVRQYDAFYRSVLSVGCR